jgi:hypothetical protein
MALGGEIDGLYPEVKATVNELSAQLSLGDDRYFVRRRLVTTPTAAVEIAGGHDEALSLPAMRSSPTEPLSYGDWLLEKLRLPRLDVPTAPTRPAESGTTRVSINDYLRYCRLTQEEIDVDVLGSSVWFKDNKRRIVFRILYGSYDAEVAALQQRLREVQAELRILESEEAAFGRFLTGTPFANRAELEVRQARAKEALTALSATQVEDVRRARETPHAQRLQVDAAELDSAVAQTSLGAAREQESERSLLELRNQLQTQSGRLTRAIVAGEAFFDFDFHVCPRCGNAVDRRRADEGDCYLCLQPEPPAQTREDLVREQARVNLQIAETEELVASHQEAAAALAAEHKELTLRRAAVGQELDRVLEGFVSDNAEKLAARAAEMAALSAEVERLSEYLEVFDKFAEQRARAGELAAQLDEIETALAQAERVDAAAEARIEQLEERFRFFVDTIHVPEFAGQPRAGIDRANYEPIVNGRHLDGLSAGVRVLVNVAHLLAHHLAAVDLDIPLPGLALIDGVTKNIGTAEYDAQRIEDIWRTLVDLHETMADDLQIVVAANDLPDFIGDEYIALRLSEDDRLVPSGDLEAIGWDPGTADDGGGV